MITAEEVRELTITPGTAPDRPAYLSAASGLVCGSASIYVVADDEHHLGVFPRDGHAPGELFRLVDGELPPAPKARKKQKPDFEVLLRLPAFGGYSNGALLALASGSRPNRHAGAIIGMDRTGALQGEPKNVDLSFIFGPLGRRVAALNIEGAVALGAELLLFQRGNKNDSTNAIIRFPLTLFWERWAPTGRRRWSPFQPKHSIWAESTASHSVSRMPPCYPAARSCSAPWLRTRTTLTTTDVARAPCSVCSVWMVRFVGSEN